MYTNAISDVIRREGIQQGAHAVYLGKE
jgi:hypothetical protein